MLKFVLSFEGNRQTIESIDLVYNLADLQSDEEAESIISCLCLDIGMTGKSKFCIFLNSSKLLFSWDPTLAYFLIELPFVINRIEGEIFEDYYLTLNEEVNNWEIIFIPFSKNKVTIKFDNKEGKIIETKMNLQQLKKQFNFLLNAFIDILKDVFPDVLKIEVFNQWIVSSFYENI